jgi:hypothetical protein
MVAIEAAPTTFKLRAGYPGQVIEVLPGRGAIISTDGAFIQCVWGSGGEAVGVLEVLVEDRNQPLRATQLNPSSAGSVVVAGWIVDGEGLDEADHAGVSGVIVGGVDASLRQRLRSLPYPVLVVEAFGASALSDEAFAILKSHAGREAMLSGGNPGQHMSQRPDVLIPVNRDGDTPPYRPNTLAPQIGMSVRCLCAPYSGGTGILMGIPPQPQIVESGLRVLVAEVELATSGKLVRIPLANLERAQGTGPTESLMRFD